MSEQLLMVLKALSDQTRLDIVRRLARERQAASCGEVRSCSSLSQPAMSHHFAKLVDAGIVIERKAGKEKYYELNTPLLEQLGLHKIIDKEQ